MKSNSEYPTLQAYLFYSRGDEGSVRLTSVKSYERGYVERFLLKAEETVCSGSGSYSGMENLRKKVETSIELYLYLWTLRRAPF